MELRDFPPRALEVPSKHNIALERIRGQLRPQSPEQALHQAIIRCVSAQHIKSLRRNRLRARAHIEADPSDDRYRLQAQCAFHHEGVPREHADQHIPRLRKLSYEKALPKLVSVPLHHVVQMGRAIDERWQRAQCGAQLKGGEQHQRLGDDEEVGRKRKGLHDPRQASSKTGEGRPRPHVVVLPVHGGSFRAEPTRRAHNRVGHYF
mmetsp:Transcript_71802/g.186713  ORF Transcript_71802/g.186713 Transcript_71802/m.186713 type:complete len:206 (-) Transcript_71802:11-628(-)